MKKWLICFFSVSFCSFSWATQPAIVVRNTPLLSDALQSSASIASIEKDTEVLLLQRKGGWYKIETLDHKVGWLRMLAVRFISTEEANDLPLAALIDAKKAIAPALGIATGVRGATGAELEDSKHDPDQDIVAIKQFVPTAEEVDEFAKQGELVTQDINAEPQDQ